LGTALNPDAQHQQLVVNVTDYRADTIGNKKARTVAGLILNS
jgi:hypothetical protein